MTVKGNETMDMSVEEYNKEISKERKKIPSPFDMAYETFITKQFDKQDSAYFKTHASEFVEQMRRINWEEYQKAERRFTTYMLKLLINDERISQMSPKDAICDFVENNPIQIYNLTLSNTQSRRSRAGKEFEAIIELMLIGASLPVDSQGSIGRGTFTKKGLGKLVDFVSPGVVQFMANKRNTVLVSAKTTLRERWQEVPEEIGRTGSREIYLATLDEQITDETRSILYESNVIIATTRKNKEENYNNDSRIVSFEELISIIQEAADKWTGYNYTDDEKSAIRKYLQTQIDKHIDHPYVQEYYKNRLLEL